MSEGNAPPPAELELSEARLANALARGKGTRWLRIALQCIAGAISAAGGGIMAMVQGATAAGVGAFSSASSEAEQDSVNDLMQECLRAQREKINEIGADVMRILTRLNLEDKAVLDRLESPAYQSLLRSGFRAWAAAEGEHRREYLRRLLTHAADPRVDNDDLIRLFIGWVERFSDLHFRVLTEVFSEPNVTRADIWARLNGVEARDDSAEADVFKCLISDLTLGYVIRQRRESDPEGRFPKAQRTTLRRGTTSGYRVSAFDDNKEYVLTAAGRTFVHYTMTELVEKLAAGVPPS